MILIIRLLFIRLINNSKDGCDKNDFYSSWGLYKVEKNISDYFDEKNALKFNIYRYLSYVIFLLFAITILGTGIFLYYYGH